MIVYYGFMIVLVPIISVVLVKFGTRLTRISLGKLAEKAVEHVTTGFLFSQVLPYVWNKIDITAERKINYKIASKKN